MKPNPAMGNQLAQQLQQPQMTNQNIRPQMPMQGGLQGLGSIGAMQPSNLGGGGNNFFSNAIKQQQANPAAMNSMVATPNNSLIRRPNTGVNGGSLKFQIPRGR